jgi:biotin carboxyl carrier protein
MARFKVRLNGQERELEVTRQGDDFGVTQAGKKREVRLLHRDGAYFVLGYEEADGTYHLIRAAGHVAGHKRQLWVNGRSLTYERVAERTSGPSGDDAGGDAGGSLSSAIPAVVAQVLVKVGDVVAAGQKLILLESMKMVIPIQAPYEGRIVRVNYAAGEAVPPGVPLVELEKREI